MNNVGKTVSNSNHLNQTPLSEIPNSSSTSKQTFNRIVPLSNNPCPLRHLEDPARHPNYSHNLSSITPIKSGRTSEQIIQNFNLANAELYHSDKTTNSKLENGDQKFVLHSFTHDLDYENRFEVDFIKHPNGETTHRVQLMLRSDGEYRASDASLLQFAMAHKHFNGEKSINEDTVKSNVSIEDVPDNLPNTIVRFGVSNKPSQKVFAEHGLDQYPPGNHNIDLKSPLYIALSKVGNLKQTINTIHDFNTLKNKNTKIKEFNIIISDYGSGKSNRRYSFVIKLADDSSSKENPVKN